MPGTTEPEDVFVQGGQVLYQHTIEFQKVLQRALRLANHFLTDAEIVTNAQLPRSKSIIQKFRVEEDLKLHMFQRGRLKLDYVPASMLWKYLNSSGYIYDAVKDDDEFKLHCELMAASSVYNLYSSYKDVNNDFISKDAVESSYFCYKPSFRKPGHIIKSQFDVELVENEYFRVKEHQEAKSDEDAVEDSSGFGFLKSDRLWIFLKEVSKEQPRIFCFNKRSISRDNRISKLFGYVIESDKKFEGGVFSFKVGLASVQSDKRIWETQHKGEPYNKDHQIDSIPFTENAKQKAKATNKICLDQEMISHIQSDVLDIIDSRAPD